MTSQIGYIILDALFNIRERKEVDGVNGGSLGLGIAGLEAALEVRILDFEHTAVGMVNNGDVLREGELLGNNERAEGFLAIRSRTALLSELERSTYAAPPALRMTCASPSLMPRAAAGLVNQSQSVQLSRDRGSNCSYSIRVSMQVTTANFLPGSIGRNFCQSRFSDEFLMQRHEPNLSSEVVYIHLIIKGQPLDVGHASFLAGWI